MSDDRTVRIGPDGAGDGEKQAARRNPLVGTVVAVVVAAAVLALFVLRGGRDDQEEAAPLPSATATPPVVATTAPPTPAPTASPTAGATPPPEPEPSPTAADPTVDDVTAFIDAYEAEHGDTSMTRIVDVDNDGVEEIVAARVEDATIHIDLAAWDGSLYAVAFSDEGGAADDLEDLGVRDLNRVAGLEIITFQTVGEEGSSVSLWGPDDEGQFGPQPAQGGCWDGEHTYGIIGVTVEPGRIEATCDGSPLPPQAWPSDVYVWDGAWVYSETIDP